MAEPLDSSITSITSSAEVLDRKEPYRLAGSQGTLMLDTNASYDVIESYGHMRYSNFRPPTGLEFDGDDDDDRFPSSLVNSSENQGPADKTGTATQSVQQNEVRQPSTGPGGASLNGRTAPNGKAKLAAAARQAVLPGLGAGALGALAGCAIGAIIGTLIFPGAGTAAGAILGAKLCAAGGLAAAVGGFGGYMQGAYQHLVKQEKLVAAMQSPQARQPSPVTEEFELPREYSARIDLFSESLDDCFRLLKSRNPSLDVDACSITGKDRQFVSKALTAIVKDALIGRIRKGSLEKSELENRGDLEFGEVRNLIEHYGMQVLKSMVEMKAATDGRLNAKTARTNAVKAGRDLLKTMTSSTATERDIVLATTRAVTASRLYSLARLNAGGDGQPIGDRQYESDLADVLNEARRSSWGLAGTAEKLLERGHPVRALIMHGESLKHGMPERSAGRVIYSRLGGALQVACRALAGNKSRVVNQTLAHITDCERMMFAPGASPQSQMVELQQQGANKQKGADAKSEHSRMAALERKIGQVYRYQTYRPMDRIAPAADALFEKSQQLSADLMACDAYLNDSRDFQFLDDDHAGNDGRTSMSATTAGLIIETED